MRHPLIASWIGRSLVALLLTAGWIAPLAFPHAADDDALCLSTDASGHDVERLVAGEARAAADHCAVCHLHRTVRGARVDARAATVGLAPGRLLIGSARFLPSSSHAATLPARAPPSLFA